MKTTSYQKTVSTSVVVIFALVMLLSQSACRKTEDPLGNLPTKFTDLKVDPSFQFDNFINLDVTIGIPASGDQMLSIVQIFESDPKTGGKMVATGSVGSNLQFKTSLRVASRLKELWVGKISLLGINDYIAVPIQGSKLNYTFGQSGLKSTDATASNDCNTGTPITVNVIVR